MCVVLGGHWILVAVIGERDVRVLGLVPAMRDGSEKGEGHSEETPL